MSASKEMPKYRSHKEVWALKIANIEFVEETDATPRKAVITPEDVGYAKFSVDSEYLDKHKPQIGGYYVVYKGGYKSWSPADAFEDGYTRI
ncbi:MAG: hypothetical protein MRY72_12265 [Aquisalinus sp.]|nr:hypothetical protein [Aquisalinus sp.]